MNIYYKLIICLLLFFSIVLGYYRFSPYYQNTIRSIELPTIFEDFANEQAMQQLLCYFEKSNQWVVRSVGTGIECYYKNEINGNEPNQARYSIQLLYPSLKYQSNESIQEDTPNRLIVNRNISISYDRHVTLGFSSHLEIMMTPCIKLSIFETGKKINRIGSLSAIKYLADCMIAIQENQINKILETEESILNMPKERMLIENQKYHFSITPAAITGWINMGERGCLVVLCDNLTTKIESSPFMDSRMHTFVGWSTNQSERFTFSYPLYVRGDGFLNECRIQIWYYPYGRKVSSNPLFSTNVILQTYTR